MNEELKERIDMINRGEVPKGYKKTKVGIIPEDWNAKKIKDVAKIYLGLTYTPTYVSNGIPFLSVKDISGGKINFDDIKYISEDEFNNSTNNAKPKKGDVLFGRVGTLGNPIIIEDDVEFCIFVSLGFLRILDTNVLNYFIKYWMDSEIFNRQIESKIAGSSQKNLNTGWLKEFDINLPKLKEQQKIAQILSTWDKAIELKEKLIEAKKEQKKGLMQRLLTGEVRLQWFEGEWEEVRLGDVGNITMGQSPSSDNYNENGMGLPLIQGNADIENRYTSPRLFTSEITKKCEIGDIIMSVRAPVGEISKSIHKACIGRGVCSINSEDNDYLYYYLINSEEKWTKYSQGSTFESVNSKDIKNFKVLKPKSKDEQKAIAQILSTADKEIDLLNQELEQLKEQKKGLMQLLLTGKIRVSLQ